ncbi:MAG TPA: DUF1579 domain-containing protein [Flavobacterium sp.]|jgi:hypothetical protein
MRKIILSVAVFSVVATSCKKEETKTTTTEIQRNDTVTVVKDEASEVPMDSVAMMKAWDNYMTPGEPHKMLSNDVGTWDEESTMYMKPNDPNPMKTKMTAVNKMVFGGRYQESRHTGTVMGQPFEGVSVMGYDNAAKKLVSTWYDNMGTGIMYMTGDFNPNSKTVELRGEVTDPMTGKKKAVRETYTFTDENTRHMIMYDVTPEGTEYKSMEIVMKRRK